MRYWQIREDQQPLVAELQRCLGPGNVPGHRYIAFSDGAVAGKGYLSLAGPAGVAAIFGMSVLPHARAAAWPRRSRRRSCKRARQHGCHRAVLHSTEMAVAVYRRAGFLERCSLTMLAGAAPRSADR